MNSTGLDRICVHIAKDNSALLSVLPIKVQGCKIASIDSESGNLKGCIFFFIECICFH